MRAVSHEERIYRDPGTAALIVAGVATASSIDQQKRAARASKRAQRAQQVQADLQTARERRNQIRQARIQRAQLEAQALAQGTTGASSVVGAAGSVQSQLGSNIGFLNQQQQLSQFASAQNQRAAAAQTRASIFSSVASLATTAGTSGVFKQSPTTPNVV